MSFPKKKCSVGQRDVEVSCVKIAHNPNPGYIFSARIGDVVYDHPLTVTIGPLDGELPEYLLEQLQKDVDNARVHAATHAAFRHHLSEIEGQVK
jgi:hypothetical protein